MIETCFLLDPRLTIKPYSTDKMILTGCFLLLLGHTKSTSLPIPDSHAFTQRSQIRIVLLVAPDVQEWFAVGEFEVVVFGQTGQLLACGHDCIEREKGLTLEKLPKEPRIPESPPRLPP